MNKYLLIVGPDIYSMAAKDIAKEMFKQRTLKRQVTK
jgi:hypothetical protein